MKTASFCCNESQQLSLFQFPFSANAFSESRAPKYKKGETIKVSPDSVLFIHISWKRARRFGILFAMAWEKHPRRGERFGGSACTPFIYSRQQVAHEIRLIRSNGRGAASVVLFPLCMSPQLTLSINFGARAQDNCKYLSRKLISCSAFDALHCHVVKCATRMLIKIGNYCDFHRNNNNTVTR